MLTRAITRAWYAVTTFTEKYPGVLEWLEGRLLPTVKQLQDFSKQAYLSFGYLFLEQQPQESLPIPFYRRSGNQADDININVHDTILLLQ